MQSILNNEIVKYILIVVDILAVAYVIYFVYMLIEDSNSMNIVKGFLLVIAIYFISEYLGLKTLAWILKYVVSYFFITFVILFQPEIRKVFLKIGFLGMGSSKEKITEFVIKEVIAALKVMSQTKTGGIIIFKNKVGLKNLTEDAVKLNAIVNKDLILSIFQKTSPIHDGALLIEGEKIIAAKVIIPYLKIEAVSKDLTSVGTRHRAGVASTLDNDAFTIIVSEERGTISLGYNGKLFYDIDIATLEEKMNELISKNNK